MSAELHRGIRSHEPYILHFLELRVCELNLIGEERILLRNPDSIASVLAEGIRNLCVLLKGRAAGLYYKPILSASAEQDSVPVPFGQFFRRLVHIIAFLTLIILQIVLLVVNYFSVFLFGLIRITAVWLAIGIRPCAVTGLIASPGIVLISVCAVCGIVARI